MRSPQRTEEGDRRESKGEKMADREENRREHGEREIAKTATKKDPGPGAMSLTGAVKSLNRQTERGEHVPEMGGHKMHGHSGSMKGHEEE